MVGPKKAYTFSLLCVRFVEEKSVSYIWKFVSYFWTCADFDGYSRRWGTFKNGEKYAFLKYVGLAKEYIQDKSSYFSSKSTCARALPLSHSLYVNE